MSNKVRIGIDVGGTFTHAVALASPDGALLAQAKVPTTHEAQEGVAAGILEALRQVMGSAGVEAAAVGRVAYSTTQVTNALLEGDVAVVGILAAGRGWEGRRAQNETAPEAIELSPGRMLAVHHAYVELQEGSGLTAQDETALRAEFARLKAAGAEAVVVASAFSVDDPALERALATLAEAAGLPATATHEISQLYGLKVRTRTAAINAALLPKMIQTARRTEEAVRALGIQAPLVVMRSDGGAMDIGEMKKRPILTILSGPAAGVAAALMAARVSDGLFLEVGGTSTDISAIQNGHPSIKPGRIGPHRLYLNTLDVRTVGVAGGSMARLRAGRIHAVGPRSAHIAGLGYSAFNPSQGELAAATLSPKPFDPDDYLFLRSNGGARLTVTPTCAANFLGLLAPDDNSRGQERPIREAFSAVAKSTSREPEQVASELMERGAEPILATIREFIDEYSLDSERLQLVGGGGGAGVWLNFLGKKTGMRTSIVEHAPVISAIGTALALLQETVERTLIEPTPEDFAQIRRDAEAALIRSGAAAGSVEVRVEVDSQRGVLRATALGSHELSTDEKKLSESELALKAAEMLGVASDRVKLAARTERFSVFQATVERKRLLGLLRQSRTPWRVLDQRGRARLGSSHGEVVITKSQNLIGDLRAAMERLSEYGDAGQIFPRTFLVLNDRTVDLSGLMNLDQIMSICHEELRRLKTDDPVVLTMNLDQR